MNLLLALLLGHAAKQRDTAAKEVVSAAHVRNVVPGQHAPIQQTRAHPGQGQVGLFRMPPAEQVIPQGRFGPALHPKLMEIYGIAENGDYDEAIDRFCALEMKDQLKIAQDGLEGLDEHEYKAITSVLRKELGRIWIPLPGPQRMAYESKADVLLYGGSGGGGKSDLILGLACQEHFNSLIMRREASQLKGIIQRSRELYAEHATYNGSDKIWRFAKDKREILLAGVKQPEDWIKWAGQPRDLLAFDEGGEFLKEQVLSLMGWVRSTRKGQRCRTVIASNPPRGPEGAWLIEMFQPWLDPSYENPAIPGELRYAIRVDDEMRWLHPTFNHDGVPEEIEANGEKYTPMSYTFIPARLDDNPFLSRSNYRAQLQSLAEPLRSQLLHGDFLAGRSDNAWQVIPTEWVEMAMARWTPGWRSHGEMTALGVDVAMGGGDQLVLSRCHGVWFDDLIVLRGVDSKNTTEVAARVFAHIGPAAVAVIDMGGGYGDGVLEFMKQRNVAAVGFRPAQVSEFKTMAGAFKARNCRAAAWWGFREALDPSNGVGIMLPPDDALKQELTAPLWRASQSLGGEITIESKDDIKARLGRSTDRADGVITAYLHSGAPLPDPRAYRRNDSGLQTHAHVGYADVKRHRPGASGPPLQRYAHSKTKRFRR